MKAFFVGGPTDNSELDLDVGGGNAPAHYPPDTGTGVHRYRLERAVQRDDRLLYAVYAPPEMKAADVDRIVSERASDRRFSGQAPG